MGRKRNKENEGLPPNLYKRKGLFFYRDPRTKIEYSLGKNKSLSITESIQANLEILKPKVSLLDRINNVKIMTLHEWLDEYILILKNRNLKPKSMADYISRINIIKNKFDNIDIKLIEPKDIHNFISSYSSLSMAKLLRFTLSDSLNEAIAAGIIDKNPVSVTKPPKVTVKRSRLSLEQFNHIIGNSSDKYRNIFMLALLTGQRIGDIVKIKWTDIFDNKLHIEQSKTGSKIAIPLNLNLNVLGFSINDVINNLKNNSELVCNISPTSLRNNFSKHLDGIENKPTFHEIRSLSARLYEEEKGAEFASKLLGHKSMAMTDKYLDNRDNGYFEL